ncbi:MAG UNVERIFIED_CONTAM: hypothetical protein LVR18_23920 [Planctomycetaceae bacterium]
MPSEDFRGSPSPFCGIRASIVDLRTGLRKDNQQVPCVLFTPSSDAMPVSLSIPVIDCRNSDARQLFRQLREKLSPRGDVVSEAGRQRTIELFGEPLSPARSRPPHL